MKKVALNTQVKIDCWPVNSWFFNIKKTRCCLSLIYAFFLGVFTYFARRENQTYQHKEYEMPILYFKYESQINIQLSISTLVSSHSLKNMELGNEVIGVKFAQKDGKMQHHRRDTSGFLDLADLSNQFLISVLFYFGLPNHSLQKDVGFGI